MTRKDLLTNEDFAPKRSNQKFATQSNRIKYHNDKANALRKASSFVNKPLMTNLNILNSLLQGKTERIFHKEFLKGKGFNFEVCTHLTLIDNLNRFSCYQYTIIKGTNESIKIIKTKND
jgi:hypothetical protein